MHSNDLCFYKKYKSNIIAFIFLSITFIFLGGKLALGNEDREARVLRGEVIQYAENFIGKPYIFGAEGPEAFDCSGLTKYVYKRFNIDLPHYTVTQWGCGEGICKKDLREGDLVFFNTTGNLSHVGIYIGNNEFIHAPSKGKTVRVNSLAEKYYRDRYAGARRIM